MSLNKKQLSLLITTMLMLLLVLVLFNVHMASKAREEFLYEVSLPDETIEELLKEKEQLEQENADLQQVKTHMAYNQTAKSRFTEEEPFKTLEELEAEAQSNESTETETETDADNTSFESNGYALDKFKEKLEKQRASRGDDKTKELSASNTANKNSSVSYSLVDRMHIKLPSPIYTCLVSGRVVINVKVDAKGNVIEATLNEKSSSTTNGCLVENAISYAYMAKFTNGTKAEQIGTITYLYQGK